MSIRRPTHCVTLRFSLTSRPCVRIRSFSAVSIHSMGSMWHAGNLILKFISNLIILTQLENRIPTGALLPHPFWYEVYKTIILVKFEASI